MVIAYNKTWKTRHLKYTRRIVTQSTISVFFWIFFSFLPQKFGKFCFSSVKIWLIWVFFEKNPKFQYHKFEKKTSIHNIGILRMVPYCTCKKLDNTLSQIPLAYKSKPFEQFDNIAFTSCSNGWNFVLLNGPLYILLLFISNSKQANL